MYLMCPQTLPPIYGINLLKSIHFSQVSETSHVVACEFAAEDHTAQLCLRIVQWLEGLASKALDLEAKVFFPIYSAWKVDLFTSSVLFLFF